MATVFKRGKRSGKDVRHDYWYASWFDHNGKRKTCCTKTTDRSAAERIAAKKEAEAALRRDGVIDPKDDRYVEQGRRLIAQHVAEFRASLEARGNAPDYITQNVARAEAMIEACAADRIGALDASRVEQAIKRMKDDGRSVATCNSYLRSIKSFTRWLHRDRRLRDDPLMVLHAGNEETDKRRTRREPTADELARLIAATESRTHHDHALCGTDLRDALPNRGRHRLSSERIAGTHSRILRS